MCGRYTIGKPERVAVVFSADRVTAELRPRYNVAPTQKAPVVAVRGGARELLDAQWGLVPSWADDPAIGARLINARSETAADKPSFRASFRHHRCLVPADGYFEWTSTPEGRQPFYIHPSDERPLAFAGLYALWTKGPAPLLTFSILTREAEGDLRSLHDRMPVVLPDRVWSAWLDPLREDAAAVGALLGEPHGRAWTLARVSRRVNSPAHDDPECIAPRRE